MSGIVNNIERFTLHDGPGIRSTVFLKGCPLRCLWCSNPETQMPEAQLCYIARRCTGCGRCLADCPEGAITREDANQTVAVDFERCTHCGDCTAGCIPLALQMIGREMEAQEVADLLLRDIRFYQNSGGGVTLSGGEPLLQPGFAAEILRLCKLQDVHTAIQTCGMAPWDAFEITLPFLDLVIFDLKHMDADSHYRLTGYGNEQILDNLQVLDGKGVPIVLQVPLIPDLNDSDENLADIFRLACGLNNLLGVSLLAYHNLGSAQYRHLGLTYPLEGLAVPPPEYLQEKMNRVEKYQVPLIRFNG